MHKHNRILKYLAVPVLILMILLFVVLNKSKPTVKATAAKATLSTVKNTAANDSAAESLDTLTAELTTTKQQITEVSKDNQELKKQNSDLLEQLHSKTNETTAQLTQDMSQLKNQVQELSQPKSDQYKVQTTNAVQPITTVTDIAQVVDTKKGLNNWMVGSDKNTGTLADGAAAQPVTAKKPASIPYYTIPANSTSVRVRLMTALVGRIPIKGVVVDPYPFKLVFADDTLAASGWRVPHLRQMVVSGYCEGDWNLSVVRGWITSLTFVFDDGTITTTTSNDNNIGEYTKNNALGYLTDARGNPIIGSKITDAPMYLAGNVALGATQGAAKAFSQAQTTNQTSILGTMNSTVTGSPYKYVGGEAVNGAADNVSQWWHDREENSFDAIYVSPLDSTGHYREITVNFAKEIPIDYNPMGRKIQYNSSSLAGVSQGLD